MLKAIRDLLLKIVDSIDVGNSNISEKVFYFYIK